MHIIDDLVQQFSDPMAFFRELVQNAIDSGAGEVEIDLHHHENRLEISISDYGEGMTREIIETRLVRLFSSSKDEDLTKIGRFGIGFISVFAIEPEQVLVDTGREGQFWRVLFAPDRTYQLFRSEAPVEGTCIRIFKSMSTEEYLSFRRRARQSLKSWCRFASVPIYFEGEEIGEPFALFSPCTILHEEEGTRLLIGLSDGKESFDQIRAGYYNRGLTLREASRSPFPWVSFLFDSRYLEHTLTRDQLLEDRHLQKAMELLERLAVEELPELLISRIETAAADKSLPELEELFPYLNHYLRSNQPFQRSWRRRPLFPTVNGDPVSFAQVQRAHRRGNLRLSSTGAPDLIAAQGRRKLILLARPSLREALEELLDTRLTFIENEVLSLSHLRSSEPSLYAPLKLAIKTLLAGSPTEPDDILFVPARSLGYPDANPSFLLLPTRDELIQRRDWNSPLGSGSTVVINVDLAPDGKSIAPIAEEAAHEPELAAYALMELLRPDAVASEDLLLKTIARRRTRLNEDCP